MDESHNLYSDATHVVGQLELYLNAIEVVLFASEREMAVAQATTANA